MEKLISWILKVLQNKFVLELEGFTIFQPKIQQFILVISNFSSLFDPWWDAPT